MRLSYHPDAEAELIEAAQFYERRASTLGTQFLDAADLSVAAIMSAPSRWSILEENVRRYLMPRFPYAIYYRFLGICRRHACRYSAGLAGITAGIRITGATVCPDSLPAARGHLPQCGVDSVCFLVGSSGVLRFGSHIQEPEVVGAGVTTDRGC